MNILRDILNPGWVSSAIGILGLLIALILYRASVIGARPVYKRRSLRLIGKNEQALPKDVEIRFNGQVVDRLTKNYIVLWNSGKKLLRGTDIVCEDPLRCEFAHDARILDARVVITTRPTNKFTVGWPSETAHSVIIMFDYLDPGDGAVLEILHTDRKAYPDIRGTIRGVPKGCLDWGRIQAHSTPFPLHRRRAVNTMFFAGVLALAFSIWLPESANKTFSVGFRRSLGALGLLYAALPLAYYWLVRRRYPRGLKVQELEE